MIYILSFGIYECKIINTVEKKPFFDNQTTFLFLLSVIPLSKVMAFKEL